jgi:hypothetical protein
VEAGYTLNWSKSFEHSLATSYTTTFTAGPYDQVIVQRTPALVYSYQIQKSDGTYDASNYYQFTVPLEPVYTKLSVDEYNQFRGLLRRNGTKQTSRITAAFPTLRRIPPSCSKSAGQQQSGPAGRQRGKSQRYTAATGRQRSIGAGQAP